MEPDSALTTRRLASRAARALLAINLVTLLPLALWPLVAPQGFYDTFPGGPYHWIDINGPYNEHFLRDFGALNAALAVVIAYALWRPRAELVRAAGLAIAVYALPHTVYHLAHLDVYADTTEKIAATAPLVLQIFMGAAIAMLPSPNNPDRTPAPGQTSGGTSGRG